MQVEDLPIQFLKRSHGHHDSRPSIRSNKRDEYWTLSLFPISVPLFFRYFLLFREILFFSAAKRKGDREEHTSENGANEETRRAGGDQRGCEWRR